MADPYIKWYYYERKLTDPAYEQLISGIDVPTVDNRSDVDNIRILSTRFSEGSTVKVDLNGVNPSDVRLRIVGASGVVCAESRLNSDGSFLMPANISNGLYIIRFDYNHQHKVFKVVVR